MKKKPSRWILLSYRPDLRPTDTQVLRSFSHAKLRLQRGDAIGLLVDASFSDKSRNAWGVAYAARELFPKIQIAVINAPLDSEISKFVDSKEITYRSGTRKISP